MLFKVLMVKKKSFFQIIFKTKITKKKTMTMEREIEIRVLFLDVRT